jgi:hypothetical protein
VDTGVMLVWSNPADPSATEDYHAWYDQQHLGEILELDGFVSARRLDFVEHDRCAEPASRNLAVYELQAEDLGAAMSAMLARTAGGEIPLPSALQTDPRPVIQLYRTRSDRHE